MIITCRRRRLPAVCPALLLAYGTPPATATTRPSVCRSRFHLIYLPQQHYRPPALDSTKVILCLIKKNSASFARRAAGETLMDISAIHAVCCSLSIVVCVAVDIYV